MEGLRISNKEYRNREGVSSTDLKYMTKSPAHFRYWKDNPQEDTPALLFGRAVHKYVLEKDDFFKEFEIAKDFKYGSKADKEETQKMIREKSVEVGKSDEWDSFISQNPKKEDVIIFYKNLVSGKDIITQEDFEKIQSMYDALYNTPYISQLLSGKKELSFFSKDEKTGLTLKTRPDCLTDLGDTHLIIDYKSTTDASSESFMKDAIKLNYDLQMSFYKDIADKIRGFEHTVIFIAQEKTAPYLVNVLEANEYFIKSGRDMYRTYLDMYAECEKSGNWYGYTFNAETGKDGINTLGLPNWLQKQYEV